MGRLENRVVVVTGAGRGLGRSHAEFMAREGACVVVNDLGTDQSGATAQASLADEVVAGIVAGGGRAIASHHDVADWDGAAAMIGLAIETFDDLHVLVNNAGILRDRTLANLSEAEWDSVIRVHLKGHAAPTHHAMKYWRERFKAGHEVRTSIIHTSSISGLIGNYGQANYTAAKLGIVGLSMVAALEGERYGIRSNAVAPSARTRLAAGSTPEVAAMFAAPVDKEAFDPWDPGNVSSLIVWLAGRDCPATAQIFHVLGRRIRIFSMPSVVREFDHDGGWTAEALDAKLPSAIVRPRAINEFIVPK
jgi:NAD(P)-dependent dehydrogenase (short-subunit alcohol dehydrogenase family)